MPCPPVKKVCPPKVICRDVFHPQPVEIIQPIEIVNRHYCVPVPYVVTTVTVRDEFVTEQPYGPVGVLGAKKKPSKRNK